MPDNVFFYTGLFLAVISDEDMPLGCAALLRRLNPSFVADKAAFKIGRFANIKRFGPEEEATLYENINPAAFWYLAVSFGDFKAVAASCFAIPILASENKHRVLSHPEKINHRRKSVNLRLIFCHFWLAKDYKFIYFDRTIRFTKNIVLPYSSRNLPVNIRN